MTTKDMKNKEEINLLDFGFGFATAFYVLTLLVAIYLSYVTKHQ